ncbi:hypothetical protein T08_2297, partial [Trichinella sp. T8]
LFDVDRKVRLAFAPQETNLVSLSVKGQGFLKSFHHLVSSGATTSSGVIPIASISQNFRNAASVGSSTFVKRTLASSLGLEWGFPQIIQPSSVSRAIEPVAFLFIRPVTKS